LATSGGGLNSEKQSEIDGEISNSFSFEYYPDLYYPLLLTLLEVKLSTAGLYSFGYLSFST